MNRLVIYRKPGQIVFLDTADGPIVIKNSAATKLTIEAPPTVQILRAEAKRPTPPADSANDLTPEERADYLARIEELRRHHGMHSLPASNENATQ